MSKLSDVSKSLPEMAPSHAPADRPRTRWAWTTATFFGIGYLKPGPGTWGSVTAMLLWLAAAYALHPRPAMLAAGTLAASLLALRIGIPAATIVERESGGQDPQHVVLDEVAGQWLALVPVAFAHRVNLYLWLQAHSTWPHAPQALFTGPRAHLTWQVLLHALLALGLFRLFDITKPPPARNLEALHGGVGIMMDDIAAGVYAAVVLLVVQHWW